jgi:hypothetical protein
VRSCRVARGSPWARSTSRRKRSSMVLSAPSFASDSTSASSARHGCLVRADKPCEHSGLSRAEALERATEQGERLIEVCRLGDVKDRLLDRREPWPAQRVHAFVELPRASHPSPGRICDRERVGHQDLDEPRRRRHQSPHVRSGSVRPRGIWATRQQRRQRLSAPVVPTGQGQVHAALHAAPPSLLHPDVDGPSGHPGRQALSPGDQAALLGRHGAESLERGWGRRRPWCRPSQPRVGGH